MPEERYLLIDAYNVIYATDELREVLRENLDAARDRLTEMVASIHDAEGVRTALILDSRNSSLEVDHPFGNKTFEWIYAPSLYTVDYHDDGTIRKFGPSANCPADFEPSMCITRCRTPDLD